MNWDQFIAAVASLRAEPVPLGMMSGVAHDNATSDISGPPTGKPFNNDYASLIAAKVTGDFVWLGLGANKVQADGSGGHPLLLGMRTGYCAGRIEDYGFFFHSGHFHPEVEHAIPFVIDFITRSCAHLAGGPRDEEVDRLSKLRLRFYEKNSTTETYFTNFAELAKIHGRVRVAPATHALSVSDAPKGQIVGYRDGPWGMKIPIYAEPASPSRAPSHAPSHAHGAVASTTLSHTALSLHNGMGLLPPSPATKFVAKPTIAELPADKSAPTMAPIRPLNLGVTPTGQYFAGLKLARAIWMPDGERDNCARCHVVFTFFNRKHHCRKCGDLVCNGCSGHTRKVHMPATAPNEAAVDVTESARVCSMCVKRLDL